MLMRHNPRHFMRPNFHKILSETFFEANPRIHVRSEFQCDLYMKGCKPLGPPSS